MNITFVKIPELCIDSGKEIPHFKVSKRLCLRFWALEFI
jgi:hypothetical protein